MIHIDYIKISISNLQGNMLRTILTAIGVMVGVAAIMAVVSFSEGNRISIKNQMEKLGDGIFWLSQNSSKEDLLLLRQKPTSASKISDILKKYLKESQYVSPVIVSNDYIIIKGNTYACRIVATTPDYLNVWNMKMLQGLYISSSIESSTIECALENSMLVNDLYQGKVIGKTINYKGNCLNIIGVTSSKDNVSFNDNKQLTIYISINKLKYLNIRVNTSFIYCKIAEPNKISDAMYKANKIIKKYHTGPEKYTIINMAELAKASEKLFKTVTLITLSIAIIALLVGCIGIMNIMLVSVKERTFEIGIHRAFGALKANIICLFFIESLIISTTGGILGIALGVIIPNIFVGLIKLPFEISYWSIGVGLISSLFVGLFASVYPAYKASRLTPINALRYY